MALNRQPVIATVAMMRMPDEIPNANDSKGINPRDPQIKPKHPITVSELPTYISSRQLNCFEVFTINPKIVVSDNCQSKLKNKLLRKSLVLFNSSSEIQ
jgi:hypothetical protein